MKRSQLLIAVGALACGVAAPCAAQPAAAESSALEPTRFELRSPAGCGSFTEFVGKVQARSSRIRLVESAPGGRALLVEIQPPDAAGMLAGTVSVLEPDGAVRARQLKAKSCDEALEALSLIATVTLDPDALSSEPAPPPAASPPAPPAPKPRLEPRPRARPSREPYRVSFGLAAAALLEVAPEPALGGAVSAAFEVNPGDVFSPWWRLTVTHAQRRGVPVGGGDANFAFTLPMLDVCPVRLGPRALGVRPCAYGSLGLLEVWGSAAPQSESHSRATGSAGGALWLGWRVSEAFEIIADAHAGVPLVRDEFAFDGVGFFKTRPLVFSVAAGVAGGFP